MKHMYCLIVFMAFWVATPAQSLQPWVLASVGETHETPNRIVSWTLGEMVIETISDGNSHILTQGFQQNKLTTTGIHTPLVGYELNVYPNPASDFLSIEMTGPVSGLILELRDMNGRLITEAKDLNTHKLVISIDSLPTGFYLLRVANREGLFIQSFKILKTK